MKKLAMNCLEGIILCSMVFMNLSQAQEDMEKLKQAAGVVEQALDDGFGAGLREIVEKNQNISEDEAAGIMQMPYYRDRAAVRDSSLKTLEETEFRQNGLEGHACGAVQFNPRTGVVLPGFVIGGGRDAAIFTHQTLKIGQIMFSCFQWRDEQWSPADNEWEVAGVVVRQAVGSREAVMFFLNKEGGRCSLPCGVAGILYQKEPGKVVASFFDRNGQPAELNQAGYRVSRVKEPVDGSPPSFYLGSHLLDMDWMRLGHWREGMIYILWSYGGVAD
ncbi:MAG: hypothetical protein LUE18_00240 [Akkermansia sp.]|nr:hypothetical protein [Akkermansia sp.]